MAGREYSRHRGGRGDDATAEDASLRQDWGDGVAAASGSGPQDDIGSGYRRRHVGTLGLEYEGDQGCHSKLADDRRRLPKDNVGLLGLELYDRAPRLGSGFLGLECEGAPAPTAQPPGPEAEAALGALDMALESDDAHSDNDDSSDTAAQDPDLA